MYLGDTATSSCPVRGCPVIRRRYTGGLEGPAARMWIGLRDAVENTRAGRPAPAHVDRLRRCG